MTTGDALLQAILDEPDADDLRLIYADWLEDHGEEERAEFIRVQCELAGPRLSCNGFMYSCSEVLTNGKNRISDLNLLAAKGCKACRQWASLTLRQEQLLAAIGIFLK